MDPGSPTAARQRQFEALAESSPFDVELASRLPLRILLAEDDEVNCQVTLRMLMGFGYEADVAANGLEVLDALQRQHYDLVLMDIQMPEMDGLEATRRIGQQFPECSRPRVIAMSANALREDADAARRAGVDGYVVKPISVPVLRDALETSGELAAVRADRPASAPAPLQAAPQLLNTEHLRSFLDLDPSGDFVAGVVASFTANSNQALAELRRAVAEGDVALAASVVHQLKGTSGTLGVLEMHRVCIKLDQLTAAGRLDGAEQLIEQCEREFRSGLAALEEFLAGHRTGH